MLDMYRICLGHVRTGMMYICGVLDWGFRDDYLPGLLALDPEL